MTAKGMRFAFRVDATMSDMDGDERRDVVLVVATDSYALAESAVTKWAETNGDEIDVIRSISEMSTFPIISDDGEFL